MFSLLDPTWLSCSMSKSLGVCMCCVTSMSLLTLHNGGQENNKIEVLLMTVLLSVLGVAVEAKMNMCY